MDNVRGVFSVRRFSYFKDFNGKNRVVMTTLARETDVTRQQAKGYAADWRGMNGADDVCEWKPYAETL